MGDNLCPECGANPCYRICPTQDPFGGDQAAEAADHDFNAQYDDVRERYMENCPRHGAYAGDCGGCNDEHYAELDGNEDDYSDRDREYMAKAKTGAEYELRRAVVDSVNNDDITF
jgi:hypothetical protein